MSPMPASPLQLLLIEDNPADAGLVKDMLAGDGEVRFRVYWANTLLAGLDRLMKGDIELILLDVSLPDSQGLDGLNAVLIHAPDVPVVLLTGWDSEDLALRAVQGGAQDYLVKGKLDGIALVRSIRRAVARQQTHAEIPKAESLQGNTKIVGYVGAKGGVGTSTIASRVSMDLHRQTGGRVLVMDRARGQLAGVLDAGKRGLHHQGRRERDPSPGPGQMGAAGGSVGDRRGHHAIFGPGVPGGPATEGRENPFHPPSRAFPIPMGGTRSGPPGSACRPSGARSGAIVPGDALASFRAQ